MGPRGLRLHAALLPTLDSKRCDFYTPCADCAEYTDGEQLRCANHVPHVKMHDKTSAVKDDWVRLPDRYVRE